MAVKLASLPDGSFFRLLHRPEGLQVGRLNYTSTGSCYVRVRDDRGGWEDINISQGTLVEPATEAEFLVQTANEDGSARERSTVESPVKIVHALCDENPTAHRDTIVELAVAKGVHPSTAKTQFYAWRKKNR